MKRMIGALVAGAFLALAGATAFAAEDGLRIFISADMEGLAGAVTSTQVGSTGSEYQKFREFMTAEVLAAIEGARAAGATEFVISDSHGSKQNLLIDRLPDDVRIIRGDPRPLSMMEGIQNGHYDGVIFIGYHAGASHEKGVMAHTMSGVFAEIQINGVPATEGMINAAIAGEFGVPVIMISGDDAATSEVSGVVGDMEMATVKVALGQTAADTMTPAAAQALIRQKAEAAVRRIGDFKPFTVETPIVLDLTFRPRLRAEVLSWLSIVERTGVQSVRFRADRMTEVQYFLKFILTYPSLPR